MACHRYFWAPILSTIVAWSLADVGTLHAQPPVEQPLPSDVDEDAAESADDLDTLLDMADQDPGQLSRVKVTSPLLQEEVTSVARQPSTVGKSPAAVFVITPEMIRRSGATNIPDVLRMVPGLEVARIDANKWAITSRGFNNLYAKHLLVQIDGRAVYTQFFSGVIWDIQDVVLEDVERIEVIRGPGATVWGANAVNGVINIITKRAKDTQGLLVKGGTGTEELGFSTVRYGGQAGPDLYWRAYGKQFERDSGYFAGDDFDDWRQARGGFRADWTPTCDDTITFQGDLFDGDAGESKLLASSGAPFANTEVYDNHHFGQNGILRWSHVIDDDSDWTLQTYYDRFGRKTPYADLEQRTFDVDLQYRFPLGQWHNVICGAGYRQIDDHFFGDFSLSLDPQRRNTNLFSYFIQDEMTLIDDCWYLTAGSKFEHNDFTSFEFQPSVRLLWTPSDRESVWASVSRAVRTPNRIDEDFTFHQLVAAGPTFVRFLGNDLMKSEDLLAFELGYRTQATDDFSWDLALFYNHYSDGTTTVPAGTPYLDLGVPAFVIPMTFGNTDEADTYGAELASTFQVHEDWQLTGSYSLLYLDVHAPPGDITQRSSPHNQAYVRSSWDLRRDVEFDLIGRYVDNLPAVGVSNYLTIDARIAWRIYDNLEWAVVGRNLLDNRHPEFIDTLSGIVGTEVQSEVYTTLTWTH